MPFVGSRTWPYIGFLVCLSFFFALTFSLGLCLSRPYCPAIAFLTNAYGDPLTVSDILLPPLIIFAYYWITTAIFNKAHQIVDLRFQEERYPRCIVKQP